MKMTKLKDLFFIEYGNQIDLNKLEITESRDGVNFVGRTAKNLGIVCKVLESKNLKKYLKGSISLSLGGSLLEAFIQEEDFYTGQNIKVLTSKKKISYKEKLFYCMCIRSNKYKYQAFGREANKTIDDLLVPSIENIPKWVNTVNIPEKPIKIPHSRVKVSLKDRKWEEFIYENIFDIKKGYYNKKPDVKTEKGVPFIGATEYNNGISSFYDLEEIEKSSKDGKKTNHEISAKLFNNAITISNNGSVGYSFYHPYKFTCSHDVNPIFIKGKILTPYIAMFLNTVIGLEKYRWAYGRKWRPTRMISSKIKLPVNNEGNPDWDFMESYIKSLPYSKNLEDKTDK